MEKRRILRGLTMKRIDIYRVNIIVEKDLVRTMKKFIIYHLLTKKLDLTPHFFTIRTQKNTLAENFWSNGNKGVGALLKNLKN